MTRLLILILFSLGCHPLSAQVDWSGKIYRTTNFVGVNRVDAGADETFIGGGYRRRFFYDPGSPGEFLTGVATGTSGFVIKENTSGGHEWVRVIDYGGPSADGARGGGEVERTARGPGGSVYAAGAFDGIMRVIDADDSVDTLIARAFVVQYDANGNLLRAHHLKTISPTSSFDVLGFQTDPEGNYYLSGLFMERMTYYTETDSLVLGEEGQSNSTRPIFVLKVTPGGEIAWGYTHSNGSIRGADNLGFANGQLYYYGSFRNGYDADPGAGETRLAARGNNGLFLSRFSTEGVFLGTRLIAFGTNLSASKLVMTGAGDALLTVVNNSNAAGYSFINGSDTVSYSADVLPVIGLPADGGPGWVINYDKNFRPMIAEAGEDRRVFVAGRYESSNLTLPAGDAPLGSSTNRESGFFIQEASMDGNILATHMLERSGSGSSLITDLSLTDDGDLLLGGNRADTIFLPNGDFLEDGRRSGFLLRLDFDPTSIAEEPGFDAPPLVFPNPARERFTVRLEREYHDVTLELYSASGRLVNKHYFDSASQMEITGTGAGLYFVRVAAEGRTETLKVVLE